LFIFHSSLPQFNIPHSGFIETSQFQLMPAMRKSAYAVTVRLLAARKGRLNTPDARPLWHSPYATRSFIHVATCIQAEYESFFFVP
jgi:hypothetical protein